MNTTMRSLYFYLLLLLPWFESYALEKKPWFYPPFEFHLGAEVEGSIFSNVDNGFNPIDYRSNNLDVFGYLLVPFSPVMDAELEIEFEQTTKYTFGFESVALQGRRQFLDDITGDFISLAASGNIRFVPKQRLRDVATPYHNLVNFEFGLSAGKEFTANFDWFLRTSLFSSIGQANKGYPWVKFLFDIEGKVLRSLVIRGFSSGYFGLGYHTLINVRHFNSYAFFKHQNVDVGVSLSYLFQTLGRLSLEYTYRAYARSFPSGYNAIKLSYDFPFSF